MMNFLRSLQSSAEEVLSISGLVLLLVAAWGGDKASRLISILRWPCWPPAR
jgi:NADH-quinone oxidoreductase subunit N